MSDDEVAALLDSDEPLVVIEAPAGCGKTYQGSRYACRAARKLDAGRILILTHTHAACGVFSKATEGEHSQVEIRTIDSLIVQIASAYHNSLGLPPDPYGWARQTREGMNGLASRVVMLLAQRPMISRALATRYPIIIGDEHQDSSAEQDAVVMALHRSGAKLRIFGDPVQRIYGGSDHSSAIEDRERWATLKSTGTFMELENPHRWRDGSVELGQWILDARRALRNGETVDLTGKLPKGLTVIAVNNRAKTYAGYQLDRNDRRPIDSIVNAFDDLLVLTGQNNAVESLAAFWGRRLPIWEGHTRQALEELVDRASTFAGDPVRIAQSFTHFLGQVAVGFSASSHGDRFVREVSTGCTSAARGKPGLLQELGTYILIEPDHVGISRCLARLWELIEQRASGFQNIKINYRREYKDAIQLGVFTDPVDGLAEINRRRTFMRPMPPKKSISTIHKAKGLECDNAMIIPCDQRTFSCTEYARCKLYVAMSRAKHTLTLVLSRSNPSPLFDIA